MLEDLSIGSQVHLNEGPHTTLRDSLDTVDVEEKGRVQGREKRRIERRVCRNAIGTSLEAMAVHKRSLSLFSARLLRSW